MPRVNTRRKSRRGQKLVCGADGCGREITAGESYHFWKFRYGSRQVRCAKHYPKQSELTQSKLSTVYAAVEDASEAIALATGLEEVAEAVHRVGESAREVADEYREAAENFGGQGENAERADELEGWADELESWEPDVDEDIDDPEAVIEQAQNAGQEAIDSCPL